MPAKPKPRPRTASAGRKKAAPKKKAVAAKAAAKPEKPEPGKFGIRTAPRGDRFYEPEMAVRKFALGLPQATEDFPWGHRAFKVAKKVFLFLAWDEGVFSATTKLPESQEMALTLPFAELTGYGMGKSGWVTARFSGKDEVPVPLLYRWIEESYRAVAPKKLAALLSAS
ncbi:MAG TPA: MmcQ/YjbR family DNA-binding protein [Vicinamibacteria bacterium]|nr:MmcQ/YjbR family DNA-binding protein [Vicinamibacteria bacterium]